MPFGRNFRSVSRSRSRSPLRLPFGGAPSEGEREDLLAEFARLYWLPPDEPNAPPWTGLRSSKVVAFRERIVKRVEIAAPLFDPFDKIGGYVEVTKGLLASWRAFTFFEDLARMSDVLFRGPIDVRHADDIDLRLHQAWRRLQPTISEFSDFVDAIREFRVSAVSIAMMLETARPPEAVHCDIELPDARTLASLLALRCEKDDPEELIELYRLICQKLQGCTCTWCNRDFDEQTSAGLFEGQGELLGSPSVPKVLVPPCGCAMHTLCFGDQLVPDRESGPRGLCRRCGAPYAWTWNDADPIINAFCLMFGKYIDRKASDAKMGGGQLPPGAALGVAELCRNLSEELCGLVSPASAWVLMTKRHVFVEPDTVDVISDAVLSHLMPAHLGPPGLPPPTILANQPCGDLSDGPLSDVESENNLTEVFVHDKPVDPEPHAADAISDSPLPPPACGFEGEDRVLEEESRSPSPCPPPYLSG